MLIEVEKPVCTDRGTKETRPKFMLAIAVKHVCSHPKAKTYLRIVDGWECAVLGSLALAAELSGLKALSLGNAAGRLIVVYFACEM